MEKWVQIFSENSMILPCLNSKKMWREESKETHICREFIRTENKQKESMVIHTYPFKHSQEKRLFKLHLASECRHKEKPIYSWELTSAIRHDSPRFVKLLIRITGELGDVYGDKAYSSRKNKLQSEKGGRPFLMPKNNASNGA